VAGSSYSNRNRFLETGGSPPRVFFLGGGVCALWRNLGWFQPQPTPPPQKRARARAFFCIPNVQPPHRSFITPPPRSTLRSWTKKPTPVLAPTLWWPTLVPFTTFAATNLFSVPPQLDNNLLRTGKELFSQSNKKLHHKEAETPTINLGSPHHITHGEKNITFPTNSPPRP